MFFFIVLALCILFYTSNSSMRSRYKMIQFCILFLDIHEFYEITLLDDTCLYVVCIQHPIVL